MGLSCSSRHRVALHAVLLLTTPLVISAVLNECNPRRGCNVCAECCNQDIATDTRVVNGACDLCVQTRCATPAVSKNPVEPIEPVEPVELSGGDLHDMLAGEEAFAGVREAIERACSVTPHKAACQSYLRRKGDPRGYLMHFFALVLLPFVLQAVLKTTQDVMGFFRAGLGGRDWWAMLRDALHWNHWLLVGAAVVHYRNRNFGSVCALLIAVYISCMRGPDAINESSNQSEQMDFEGPRGTKSKSKSKSRRRVRRQELI